MAVKTQKPNIEVNNLNLTYNQGLANEARVLENINLKIYPQEYVVIFGPSGCGKSTLLYSIAGFQKPTSGTVTVSDQDINALSKKEKVEFHRRKIGMIFQSFYLISSLKILDNVCLPRMFIGSEFEEREKRGRELLERFGIDKEADRFPAELSGGQRQRVAIARALINDPDVIIADEPVGNLDSKSSFNVMSILRELNEKDKKTIILVTHDPTHLSFGNKVVHMSDGKIVKIEEVVERKEAVLKGEDEEVVKKETVAPEIKMLMRSFQNFSPSQLGMLLIPFKAQEFLSHIFFNVSEDKITDARNKLQEVISGRLSVPDFEKYLDRAEEKGGAGWDKRNVRRLIERVQGITDQAAKIDVSKPEETAANLADYLIELFKLKLFEEDKINFAKLIRLRFENQLSMIELRKGLDRPQKDRGIGMDRRTAAKIARELEIILLAKFSG